MNNSTKKTTLAMIVGTRDFFPRHAGLQPSVDSRSCSQLSAWPGSLLSPTTRRGTAAVSLPEAVPAPLKKARAQKMRQLGREKKNTFCHSFIGRRVAVLVEGKIAFLGLDLHSECREVSRGGPITEQIEGDKPQHHDERQSALGASVPSDLSLE